MKKYMAFFRLRLTMGLQYRAAALGGLATQFFWGAMNILLYKAFYETDPAAFPMRFEATVTYVWLQQAFLQLFMLWSVEPEIFSSIASGDVVYELCRPVDLYDMWFARSAANRLSRALLRCFPVLLLAVLLPAPYGLSAPASAAHFGGFLLAMVLGYGVAVAFLMVVYMLTFFTVSPNGLRTLVVSLTEFLSGGIIPIPFFPERVQRVVECLPFASMQNVPLRVYSADMSTQQMLRAIGLQAFWLVTLVVLGKLLYARASRKMTVQGG